MKLKLLSLFIVLFLFSCNDKKDFNMEKTLDVDGVTKQLSINQFGVTKYASLKLRELPLEDSVVSWHLRLGSIVTIYKKSDTTSLFDGKKDYWYYINYKGVNGWMFGTYLDIFNSRYDAEKKSEEYIFNQ